VAREMARSFTTPLKVNSAAPVGSIRFFDASRSMTTSFPGRATGKVRAVRIDSATALSTQSSACLQCSYTLSHIDKTLAALPFEYFLFQSV